MCQRNIQRKPGSIWKKGTDIANKQRSEGRLPQFLADWGAGVAL